MAFAWQTDPHPCPPLYLFVTRPSLWSRWFMCWCGVYRRRWTSLSLSHTHTLILTRLVTNGKQQRRKKTEGKIKKRRSGTQTTTEIAVPTQQRLRQHFQVYISILLSENSNCPPDASIYVYAHLYLYLSQRMGVVCFPFLLLYPCTWYFCIFSKKKKLSFFLLSKRD